MPRMMTPAQVRRVLATVHGLEPSSLKGGKDGTLAVLMRHQCIQSDPIDVAGRNADLTLQSRVVDYKRQQLLDLLYKDRQLFEYFCKMHSIMPIELYPIFKLKMDGFWGEKRITSFFRKHRKETKRILKALEGGPVSSRELTDTGRMKTGWGRNARISNVILTRLWIGGKVLIHHREGNAKYYALPEQIIPRKLLTADPLAEGEDLVQIVKIIANASRYVTAGGSPEQWWEVGNPKKVSEILQKLESRGNLFTIQPERSVEKVYALAADREVWENPRESKEDYVRFLAPLDPIIWSRKIFRSVYGMEYSWEVYKKPKDRKYGYYCLPIMFNEQYVGLIDPFFRKEDRVLEIRSLHILDQSVRHSRFLSALRAEIQRFCNYLGAEEVQVKKAPHWTTSALRLPS